MFARTCRTGVPQGFDASAVLKGKQRKGCLMLVNTDKLCAPRRTSCRASCQAML